MLVRVGLAVSCSAVAFTVSKFITKRGDSDVAPDSQQKGQQDEDDFRKEPHSYVPIDTTPPKEEEEEEVKRVNTPISPAASATSLASFPSEQNAEQLLLPEFDDLLALEGGGGDGEHGVRYSSGAKAREGKKYRKVLGPLTRQAIPASAEPQLFGGEGGGDGDGDSDEPFIEVPEEFLLEDEEGRRGDLAEGFDYDFKEYVDTLANDVEELGQLRLAVRELREKEERIEGELASNAEELGQLRLAVRELREKEERMEGELASDVEELEQLRLEVRELREKEERMEGELASDVEELGQLRLEVSELREKEERMEGELASDVEELGQLRLAVSELQEKEERMEGELAFDEEELGQLRLAVRELREKEERMEGELLEYYGLQEREEDIVLMEQDLKSKSAELQALTAKLTAMEARERRSESERSAEQSGVEALKKDLGEAMAKIRELQKQLHSESGQAKAELLMLKQTLKEYQGREKDIEQRERREKSQDAKKDMEIEKKRQLLKELEVEGVELRRTNKELQHQKRELVVKLGAAESQIAQLGKIAESDLVARAEADSSALRQANEDLCKQVEGLQSSRFSEVEELVYLRWVNACLRYELRNQKAREPGKTGALDLSKDLSPRSQARAKQLMLEYAGPEAKAGEEDGYESSTSEPSISSEMSEMHELSVTQDSMSTSGRLMRGKSGLIGKLRKWSHKRGDSDSYDGSSPSSSGRSSPAHHSFRSGGGPATPKGPLESIMVRNAHDAANEITTFGAKNDSPTSESPTSPNSLKPVRTKSKDLSGVATSFSLMSKTAGAIDEKYPAFKDRHKAAVAREQMLKKRVDEKVEEMQEKKRIERETAKLTPAEIQKRELRVPNPPPKPSSGAPAPLTVPTPGGGGGWAPGMPPPPPPPRTPGAAGGPPPPPPPPGARLSKGPGDKDKMQRAPEVVEFYQSLMKRDAKKEMASSGNSAEARNNMVGELEQRSAHLLAIKADVETQGDFVKSLATEVRGAQYTQIEDVVAFVTWLDEELSFLVDERAVLKHFDWPESKADALREAAFEYQDLKKLCDEISSYEDDPRVPCDSSLKKMLAQLEKVEQSVFALLRTRDMAIARYKQYNIPTQWMMDNSLIGKIKVAAVKLAKQYMKRVATELDTLGGNTDREPVREFFLLQGVRFAFRVHQFAGGFDPESMRAFEELRNRAHKTESPRGNIPLAESILADSPVNEGLDVVVENED